MTTSSFTKARGMLGLRAQTLHAHSLSDLAKKVSATLRHKLMVKRLPTYLLILSKVSKPRLRVSFNKNSIYFLCISSKGPPLKSTCRKNGVKMHEFLTPSCDEVILVG